MLAEDRPARTRKDAIERYRGRLNLSLSVLMASAERGSYVHWYPAASDTPDEMVLTLDPYPVQFRSTRWRSVYLFADQNFRVLQHKTGDYAGQHKVTTTGYVYSIALVDNPDEAMHSWHWHPRERADPHVHVRTDPKSPAGRELHIPTGRVAFEQVVRFLITDYDVPPSDGWHTRLEENEAVFKRHRTWG